MMKTQHTMVIFSCYTVPYEAALHSVLWSYFVIERCYMNPPQQFDEDSGMHVLWSWFYDFVEWFCENLPNNGVGTWECIFYGLLPLINSTIWIWHCETWTLTHSWICIFDSWTYASLCNMAPLGQPAVNGENLNAAVFLDTINVILLLTSHSWECSFLSVLTKFWWLYQISRSQWLHTVAGIWNYYICFKNIV